ncbi:RNA polymerase sigma-70 factor [Streptomyces rapamycinicus]|uniref:RNA polymerase sigma24 factor n=2 Tax=Streptomyces rapamycinicus TaxID=1226757 RepID=A0A0A0NC72_STRRN|nr:RNA polymerase sigma-70 factor [Streptomyces rapamycinicus]AGP54851.1 RNA polymerase sigma24 factor [Streptomyces rapamycinicus NRRL 5491]MBB4782374.1 RNA polymerase sigma-70 factor (ECF subfamily) [Streptomyces rapamycinicus]RLV82142.1 RNA polymerase sigma24 factor [Streptomyces rapamycinicus NRRL 5491]UTO62893.1 RNA polymerase sigma-70 factor [Streptomyces rapamycinicus]UTP30851.1 RNA polymerase sigma-70 factor [Streptomyces rapamycinicus NRRL 5491]
MIDTTTFEEHRRMLFGIAYRMLGSVADAEDVVQDAWLRCSQVSTPVENPAGYLTRTVTNLALNRLTSAAATRERYVGPWLPEPLITRPDVGEEVELAESVSLAMLVVLESLSPLERAVFVLKEVFGFSFREIAGMLDRGEAAVRQVGSRARAHVQARRPRYDAPAEVRRQVTEEFLAACLGGDLNRMMELLAPDVTAWSDGGGKVKAALRPQRGADKVARFLAAVIAQPMDDPQVRAVDVNGRPGLLLTVAGRPDTVACAEVEDGRITEIRIIRNPEKLRHLPPP